MGVGVEFTPEDKDHMGPTCAKHSTTQDMKSCSKFFRKGKETILEEP